MRKITGIVFAMMAFASVCTASQINIEPQNALDCVGGATNRFDYIYANTVSATNGVTCGTLTATGATATGPLTVSTTINYGGYLLYNSGVGNILLGEGNLLNETNSMSTDTMRNIQNGYVLIPSMLYMSGTTRNSLQMGRTDEYSTIEMTNSQYSIQFLHAGAKRDTFPASTNGHSHISMIDADSCIQGGYYTNGNATVSGKANFQLISGRTNCTASITSDAEGSVQFGYLANNADATNAGLGCIQLLYGVGDATNAIMASTAAASIGLGDCSVTHKYSITAGRAQSSQGDGTCNFENGFYHAGVQLMPTHVSATDMTTNIVPICIGDEILVHTATQKIYRAFGLTTNDWVQVYP